MIGADPRAAGTLAIRAAIDPDAREGFLPEDASLGIMTALLWAAPLPERGPFLPLLVKSEAVGVESVLTLVEHATRRWAQERVSAIAPSSSFARTEADTFEVVIGGERHRARRATRKRCTGTAARVGCPPCSRARSWRSSGTSTVSSTPEKTSRPVLDRLKQSRSLAVWGLLVEIARYKPELLRGQLSPIVTSAALLLADRIYTRQDHSYLLMSTLADQAVAERVHSWNTMAHRQVAIMDFLMRDVVTGVALMQELTEARRHWEESDAERWKHLLAQTDTTNYRVTERADGSLMVEYARPRLWPRRG